MEPRRPPAASDEEPSVPAGAPEAAPRVAAAYDGIARGYDVLVAEDAWMRERLWAHYLRVFRPGDRVLDVACGTGLDTLHLAAHGLRMTGVDLSPGMVEQLRRKAASLGLASSVEARVEDAACLDAWPAGGFDGIVSSFAGSIPPTCRASPPRRPAWCAPAAASSSTSSLPPASGTASAWRRAVTRGRRAIWRSAAS
jgi:SAM-dependent methyltransferase